MGYGDKAGGAEGTPGGGLPAGTIDGQLLMWDADTSSWVPVAQPAGDGDYITWDATAQEWVPTPPPAEILPAGVNIGDILFWDGSNWVPNNEGVPSVGSVVIWDGSSWVPTVTEVIPPPTFDGDILVGLGGNWVRDFTFPVSTQTTWSVNTSTGNDSNVGTAASPLATYAEFFRRWSTLIVAASVSTIAVTFIGDPPVGTALILDGATFLGPTVVTVSGTMTQTGTGTITAAYVTWDGTVAGADGRRGAMTDAGADFTARVLQRIRRTNSTEMLSHIMSLGGGVTVANTGQFCSIAPATVNPAINDTYVTETPDVTFRSYQIHPLGNATFIIRDLEFVADAASRSSANVGGDSNRCLFYGCRFVGSAAALQLNDKARFAACSFEGNLITMQGSPSILNSCGFGFIQVNSSFGFAQAWAFDGGGTRNAVLFVGNYSYLEVIGGSGNFGLAFYGAVNGSGIALVSVEDFAQVVLSNAASNFIGATGNTTTNACLVRNGCGLSYVTKPKATGVGAADVVISGAAAVTWAAGIPALAAAPNNGFVNVRQ